MEDVAEGCTTAKARVAALLSICDDIDTIDKPE
jgi:hypothetical protein